MHHAIFDCLPMTVNIAYDRLQLTVQMEAKAFASKHRQTSKYWWAWY